MRRYKISLKSFLKNISFYNIKKGILYLRYYGAKEFKTRLAERFQADTVNYDEWYRKHRPSAEELQVQRESTFDYMPLISILVPVYNTPEIFLKQMLQSVREQTYRKWELCIANANPADRAVSDVLHNVVSDDPRIRVVDIPENKGIAQNTNAALGIAQGDYVGFLDHDDLLTPDALFEMVEAINKKGKPEMLYSDEDKVSTDLTEFFQPNLKPDFNKDLLRSNNYITHFFIAAKDLVERVGKFDEAYNGAQDYDMILRCAECAKGIVHIPKVLYHWRVHKSSTADNPLSKMYAFDAGKRAIESHLKRCGEKGEVIHTERLGFYRIKYSLKGTPKVSIVIPNKDQVKTLDQCLKSIEASTYKNFEILIVENNSVEDATFAYYKSIEPDNIKVIYWPNEFNYSAINNFAVSRASGDYLLFLNNDVEVITEDWIEEMVANCQRKDVGIVGAKLYYPDNTVQHAGIVIGIGGVAGSVFVGLPKDYTGYLHKASVQQDLSAVTAACMMVKRSVYDQVGGFNEQLKIAFNDVDFCLRVRSKGYLVVFDPYVELYHYESKTRGAEDSKQKILRFKRESDFMKKQWADLLESGDPMYNPNLTLTKADYTLRVDK